MLARPRFHLLSDAALYDFGEANPGWKVEAYRRSVRDDADRIEPRRLLLDS